MRAEKGFTLIELMVVVAVMGIIAGIAFPSMRDMIVNSRVTTQTNEFIAALNYARSEAIKRGADVRVCATDGEDFGGGWRIRPGLLCDDDDDVTVRHEALSDFSLGDQECAFLTFNSRGGLSTDIDASCKAGTPPKELADDRAVLRFAHADCTTGTERVRWVAIRASGRIAVLRGACP